MNKRLLLFKALKIMIVKKII